MDIFGLDKTTSEIKSQNYLHGKIIDITKPKKLKKFFSKSKN